MTAVQVSLSSPLKKELDLQLQVVQFHDPSQLLTQGHNPLRQSPHSMTEPTRGLGLSCFCLVQDSSNEGSLR